MLHSNSTLDTISAAAQHEKVANPSIHVLDCLQQNQHSTPDFLAKTEKGSRKWENLNSDICVVLKSKSVKKEMFHFLIQTRL